MYKKFRKVRILDAMVQRLAGESDNGTKRKEQTGQTVVQNRAAGDILLAF